MGRWISVYLRNKDYAKLREIVRKESERRGMELSPYMLVKEWIIEKIKLEKHEEDGEADKTKQGNER